MNDLYIVFSVGLHLRLCIVPSFRGCRVGKIEKQWNNMLACAKKLASKKRFFGAITLFFTKYQKKFI